MDDSRYTWRKPKDAAEVIAPGEICIAIYPARYFMSPVFAARGVSSDLFTPYPFVPDGFAWHDIQPLYIIPMPPLPITEDETD